MTVRRKVGKKRLTKRRNYSYVTSKKEVGMKVLSGSEGFFGEQKWDIGVQDIHKTEDDLPVGASNGFTGG